jgi:hypothetical protein
MPFRMTGARQRTCCTGSRQDVPVTLMLPLVFLLHWPRELVLQFTSKTHWIQQLSLLPGVEGSRGSQDRLGLC